MHEVAELASVFMSDGGSDKPEKSNETFRVERAGGDMSGSDLIAMTKGGISFFRQCLLCCVFVRRVWRERRRKLSGRVRLPDCACV